MNPQEYSKKEIIKRVVSNHTSTFYLISSQLGRRDSKIEDMHDFILILHSVPLDLLCDRVYYKSPGYVNVWYRTFVLQKMRKSKSKGIKIERFSSFVNRENRITYQYYEEEINEQLEIIRKKIRKKFTNADKYLQVYELIREGLSNKEIEHELGITSVKGIRTKLISFIKDILK